MMMSNAGLNRVLLCGGHRTGDLVNYRDPKSRFLYNLSDGGSALLLERGGVNPVLEASIITDGAFSLDVIIPGGGTRERTRDGVPKDNTYLTVPDVDGMRDRLADRSIANFTRVIREAASRSGIDAIDYLALLHMKKSAFDAVVREVGLHSDQAIYMDQYGHFGAPDQVLSLGLAEKRGKLQAGQHLVLASAGIGYTWSALAVEWQSPAFVNPHQLDTFLQKEESP
jgi:3-oxoacyl-[acyl-carrier-protein] synthase-3